MKNPTYTEEETYRGATEIRIHSGILINQKAEFAMRLMDHLAIASATPDGEDTTGRQKLRLLKPDEVVARAIEISGMAWDAFEAIGWTQDLPTPKPMRLKAPDQNT